MTLRRKPQPLRMNLRKYMSLKLLDAPPLRRGFYLPRHTPPTYCRVGWGIVIIGLDSTSPYRNIIASNVCAVERHIMRIIIILGCLIVGTVLGIYLFGVIWRASSQEGSMAMIVGGGTPVVLAALAFLNTRGADGQLPSLGNVRTWLTLLGIAALAAGLFVILIIALFLLVQRG